MRDQHIAAHAAQLVVGTEPGAGNAWLELTPTGSPDTTTVQLGEGELLMTIEALAMAYADLCGARPDSLARGVNRTIRNRTRSAREGQRVP